MVRSRSGRFAWIGALAPALLAACGENGVTGPDLPACGSAPLLTVSPMTYADVQYITPMGNLGPPAHVFPTERLYFYPQFIPGVGTEEVPLVSPGDVVITRVEHNTFTAPGFSNEDYTLVLAPCADVRLVFAHVSSLSTTLAAAIGPLNQSCDPPYETGGVTNRRCLKSVEIELAAGEVIGTTGGPYQGGLDFIALDRRVTAQFVNPARSAGASAEFGQNHAVCPLDDFVADVADSLRTRLGRPGTPRTVPPLCGEFMQDVAGTAAGRWYAPGAPDFPEDPHLALAHDNVDPTTGAFSVGTSVPSLPVGVYWFTPATTGRVDIDFPLVTTVGESYCYDVISAFDLRVLLMLVTPTRVRVQGFTDGPCGDPGTWAFDAGAAEFER